MREKETIEQRLYSEEFRAAMDEYLNSLSPRDKYDCLFDFWHDWLLNNASLDFIDQFIETKEL